MSPASDTKLSELSASETLSKAPKSPRSGRNADFDCASERILERARRESNPRPSDSKGAPGDVAPSASDGQLLSSRTHGGGEGYADSPVLGRVEPPKAPKKPPRSVAELVEASSEVEQLLTPAEVARRLDVNRETVYRLCARGGLKHVRVGSAIRVRPEDLERYLGRGMNAGDTRHFK
jgi:excisionase family DNA binding protein